MNPKVAIVVLVLVVIVFVAVLFMGLTGDDSSFEIPSWAQNMGFSYDEETGEADTGDDDSGGGASEKLSKSLSEDDLGPASSFCLNSFRQKQFDFSSDQDKCDFVINEDTGKFASVRKVEFQLVKGSKVHIELTQPDQLTVKKDITSDEADLSLDIFEQSGDLSIECQEPDDNNVCEFTIK